MTIVLAALAAGELTMTGRTVMTPVRTTMYSAALPGNGPPVLQVTATRGAAAGDEAHRREHRHDGSHQQRRKKRHHNPSSMHSLGHPSPERADNVERKFSMSSPRLATS
jgi:hypothetical protein